MNLWLGATPAIILTAAAVILLLRRRRKSGLTVLVGANAAVLIVALGLLVTALNAIPASASTTVDAAIQVSSTAAAVTRRERETVALTGEKTRLDALGPALTSVPRGFPSNRG